MRIAITALDDVYLSCVAGALDVVRLTANHRVSRLRELDPAAPVSSSARLAPVSLKILSTHGRPVPTTAGISIDVAGSICEAGDQFDVVFVPAFADSSIAALERRLAGLTEVGKWLRRQSEGGAVLIANHVGVYMLALAGILDRQIATIPFAFEAHFRKRFPRVKLDMSHAVVDTPTVMCGAALGASYDLFLRIIQRQASSTMARRMFHDLFFAGFHWQDAGSAGAPTGSQDVADPLVERAQSWLIQRIAHNITVRELAHFVSTSERTLHRRFKQALGVSPHEYLTNLRIETAKAGLSQTKFTIEQVAHGVGYTDSTFFAQTFRSRTGMTPTKYRQQLRPQRYRRGERGPTSGPVR